MSRWRRIIRIGLPALVSVGALVALFLQVDLGQLREVLTWKVAVWEIGALLVYGAVTLTLEAASIVRLLPAPPPGFAWTAARIKSATYLLGILNYALGVAALSLLLRRRAGIGLAESASVVLLISGLDMLVVLSMAAAGLAASEAETPVLWLAVLAVGGVGFVGGMAILRMPGSFGPLERIRSLTFFQALRTTSTRRILEVTLMRTVFVVAFVTLTGVIFLAFGIHVPVHELVVGMLVVAVVGALPIAVAGIGTGQAAFVAAFRGVAPYETLLAVSIAISAGLIALRVGMGVIFAREFTREALEESREASE